MIDLTRMGEVVITGMASMVGVAGRIGSMVLHSESTLKLSMVLSHIVVGMSVGIIVGELTKDTPHEIVYVMGSGLVANEIVRECLARGRAIFATLLTGVTHAPKKEADKRPV